MLDILHVGLATAVIYIFLKADSISVVWSYSVLISSNSLEPANNNYCV